MKKNRQSHSKKKTASIEEAQKFQKNYYDQKFSRGNECPFGEGFMQELHWEKRIKITKRFIQTGSRILDLGCGDGTVTKAVADKAEEVIGIDISEECIKQAIKTNSHPKVKYHNLALEEYQAEKDFDAVMMFEVLEHIYDPKHVINRIHSLLKKNGLLIISTPNFSNIARRIKRPVNSLVLKIGYRGWDEISPEHVCEYSYNEISTMLKECQFEIIHRDGIILIFPFPEFIKKIIQNKLVHRINFYSGSLYPPFAMEMYFIARKK